MFNKLFKNKKLLMILSVLVIIIGILIINNFNSKADDTKVSNNNLEQEVDLENLEDDEDIEETLGENENEDMDTKDNDDEIDAEKSDKISAEKSNKISDEKEKDNKSTIKPRSSKSETGEITYTMNISAFTIDGQPFNKTFESTDPNETFKFYEIEYDGNTKKTYEVTMNMIGEIVKRKVVRQEELGTKSKETKEESSSSSESNFNDGKDNEETPETYTYNETGIWYDDFQTIEIFDKSLPYDKKVVKTKGVPAKYESIYKVTMKDNKEVSRELVKETKFNDRVDEVILVGPLKKPLGNSGKTFSTESEAEKWAKEQVNDANSKWYEMKYLIEPIYPQIPNDTEYTVGFGKYIWEPTY